MEFAAILAALIAAVSLLVAIWARYDSRLSAHASIRSATAAERSADESKRASDAAEASVMLARSERDRAVERSDVAWSIYAGEGGDVEITNVGIDTAYDVSVVVRVEGVRYDVSAAEVPSDGELHCDAGTIVQFKNSEDERISAEWARDGVLWVAQPLDVGARITWQSRLGSPFVVVISA